MPLASPPLVLWEGDKKRVRESDSQQWPFYSRVLLEGPPESGRDCFPASTPALGEKGPPATGQALASAE